MFKFIERLSVFFYYILSLVLYFLLVRVVGYSFELVFFMLLVFAFFVRLVSEVFFLYFFRKDFFVAKK